MNQPPQYRQQYDQPYNQPYGQGQYGHAPPQPYQRQQGQQHGRQPYQQSSQATPHGQGQPYQAPQHQGAYRGQAVGCRICGSLPATPATFRAVVGVIFMHTIWTTHGPYCRDCGLHIFRRQTTKTLAGGWCSLGAIVLTPIFLLMNINARGKVSELAAPRPRPDGRGHAPLDPGPPVFLRPGSYTYPVLAVLLLLLIIISKLAG